MYPKGDINVFTKLKLQTSQTLNYTQNHKCQSHDGAEGKMLGDHQHQ